MRFLIFPYPLNSRLVCVYLGHVKFSGMTVGATSL